MQSGISGKNSAVELMIFNPATQMNEGKKQEKTPFIPAQSCEHYDYKNQRR
jgi:hypothetical protein